jgi:hypothetical protein
MADLKQEMQALAERHAEESSGDFFAVLTTATSRRRRRVGAWSALGCAVLAVAAIASFTPWHTDDGAPTPVATKPTLDPSYAGKMLVSPETAAPGQQILLTFPESTFRGVYFELSSADEPDKVLYYLYAERHSGGSTGPLISKAWWFSADDLGKYGLIRPGQSGPGPDKVIVPDTAGAGAYLLCTPQAAEVCGLVTVAR